MNGVTRFLSRRDKNHEKRSSKHPVHKSHARISSDLYTIFSHEDARSAVDKDVEKKVKMLLTRLQGAGIARIGEEQAHLAIDWYSEDIDKAYNLLVLANESIEGELKDYHSNIRMLGAVNRNMVTCYLDALLFAMFARLDSFEAMLYDSFDDEPRKKLAASLRLWVNMLRTGQLIRCDLTKHIQDALAKCGWEEAAELHQQDASEAFTFITGALELPLLTLKMDIYHTGREDKEDDHKFVNERLLEVAIPEQNGDTPITLEDCLETYFNNRIEVKRYLQRQNTIASIQSPTKETMDFEKDPEKSGAIHVETVELTGSDSPMVATPSSLGPATPITGVRPTLDGRRRADSIFSSRYTRQPQEATKFDEKKHIEDILDKSSGGRPRSSSLLRKEILMPAWQFFSLIPWYTDNVPKTDAQVAAHFSVKRPVLGICLKRYTMLPNGAPKRLDTFIDIPLEIGLPHFISDEKMKEEGPLFGNFKLVLQSVVCHRGVSVDSGHYVALVRANNEEHSSTTNDEEEEVGPWLRFDDLASPRVSEVDIKAALRQESPYLLFYQVQPIDEELASRGDPPTYAQSTSALPSQDPSRETLPSILSGSTTDLPTGPEWEKVHSSTAHPSSTHSDEPVGRSSISSNHRSSFDLEGSVTSFSRGRTQPSTPDEQNVSFLSASRRGSRTWLPGNNRSRPSSQSGADRLSLTISRLTGRGSKDKLQVTEGIPVEDPVIVVSEVETVNSHSQPPTPQPQPQPQLQPQPQHSAATKESKDSKKEGGIGRSKSKRTKDRFRSKSRDPVETLDKGKTREKEKSRPDRECIVM